MHHPTDHSPSLPPPTASSPQIQTFISKVLLHTLVITREEATSISTAWPRDAPSTDLWDFDLRRYHQVFGMAHGTVLWKYIHGVTNDDRLLLDHVQKRLSWAATYVILVLLGALALATAILAVAQLPKLGWAAGTSGWFVAFAVWLYWEQTQVRGVQDRPEGNLAKRSVGGLEGSWERLCL
ncbi:hypothetical protein AAFC00_004365 [Neodothiora populina]|uniref:Uncharacterized protein n=1 Tax=Neodothiora populina TaxID=2781224 RepID=A0ABR3PJQ2_9PEZI